MFKLPLWSFLAYACIMSISVTSISASFVHVQPDTLESQRNLDSKVHSANMRRRHECCLEVEKDMADSEDLYLPTYLVPFISSNETILSDGNCNNFSPFTCSSPDCEEDASTTYAVSYPHFSSNNATRISLKAQEISIGDGAWKINSSPLYLHDCERSLNQFSQEIGQIGLGLSGNAYQNFQARNPIFSIFIATDRSAELIFGLNTAYVYDNKIEKSLSLPCDLDWKVSINNFGIGNSTISTDSMVLIFDLLTTSISLPIASYYRVRDYFFQIADLTCYEQQPGVTFSCVDGRQLENLSLMFTLENGTKIIFPQSDYCYGDHAVYSISIRSHNSTFSGVEYIILGLQVLSHYYTVFQQHDDLSTTITLYPLSNSSIVTQDNPSSPEVTEESNTSGSSASEPESIDKTAPNESQLEPESINVGSRFSEKSDENSFYLVIGGLVIVIICTFIGFKFRRVRGWFKKGKIVVRPISTVELNESSIFVSNSSNGNNENKDDDIDLSG